MRQTGHILAKDIRHLWREITVTLLLVALYGWHVVLEWKRASGLFAGGAFRGGLFALPSLLSLSSTLLPLAWIYLIIRVVYDEPLVGEHQFWVTRPYDWRQLLIAKVLFLLAFISVPVLVLQLILLKIAGFAAWPYFSGLLGIEVGTLLFLFPVLVLASITAGFAQLALALVAVVFYVICTVYLDSYIPSSSFGEYSAQFVFPLIFAVGIAVVLVQYARRKTLLSRFTLVALAVVVIVVDLLFPYERFISREYPTLTANAQAPVNLRLQAPREPNDGRIPEGDKIMVWLPLAFGGVADPNIVQIRGERVFLDGPNGLHWDTGWSRGGNFLFPDRNAVTTMFRVDRKFFETAKQVPLSMRVQFALSVYHDQNRRSFTVPETMFELEGAHCAVDIRTQAVGCLAPLHRPEFVLLTADLSQDTCPLFKDQSRPALGQLARGYVAGGHPDWVNPGVDPVEEFQLLLSDYDRADEHSPHGLCPGMPVVLSHPTLAYNAQTSMSAQGVILDQYAMRIGGRDAHLEARH